MKNKLQKETKAVETVAFDINSIITSDEVISIGYPRLKAGTYTATYRGLQQIKYSAGTEKSKNKCGVSIILEIDGQLWYDRLNMFDEECIGRVGPKENPGVYEGLFNKLIIDLCRQWDVTPTGKALITNIGRPLTIKVDKYYSYNLDKITTESDTTTTTEVPTSF